MTPKRTLAIVLNSMTSDSRVLRQASSLAKTGHDVHVFALHEGELPLSEQLPDCALTRFKLTSKKWSRNVFVQVLKYFECVVRMVWSGIRQKPAFVHANDLNTLPIAYLISRGTRAKLIYDSHELWADPAHREGFPGWLFQAGLWMERAIARRADAVITVCDSIARHMARAMSIPLPVVLRNVPAKVARPTVDDLRYLRQETGLNVDTQIILHLGGIDPGRGLETLIKAMQWVDPSAAAVFMGYGAEKYIDRLRALAQQLNVHHRIYYLPAVSPENVCRYSAGATIGVALFESICLSHTYELPNKLFEYLQAGLPVVVSDLPEMAALVSKYHVGQTFHEGEANGLAAVLNSFLRCEAKLAYYREMATAAAQELNWEREEEKLIGLYDRLSPALTGGSPA